MEPLVTYLTQPLLGAFIGYLTNRIAIHMLFRPLRPWYVLGIRVPMTPGVIPSKRAALARNIGEMVGDHLLTSREVGGALSEEPFQEHLRQIIETRVDDLLRQDFNAIPDLIPRRFRAYFQVGVKTLKYQVAEGLRNYLQDPGFASQVGGMVEQQVDAFLGRSINQVAARERRDNGYRVARKLLANLLEGPELEAWLRGYLHEQVIKAATHNRAVGDMLPQTFQDLIAAAIRERAPRILEGLARVLAEPPVRTRLVKAARKGVDDFLASLGPVGAMAGNFINLETIEGRIQDYFSSKEEDVIQWLRNPDLREGVAVVLEEHVRNFMATPINQLLKDVDNQRIEAMSGEAAHQVLGIFRTRGVGDALGAMLVEGLEKAMDHGERPLGAMLEDLLTPKGVEDLREQVGSEVLTLLRSQRVAKLLSGMIDDMIDKLLARRLGVLARVLPPGIRDGICEYLTKTANRMLLKEVPGLVDSLHIRRIVTEKVDSLDLLRLEGLLLSIMDEQFRYINLFGALLGCLIGLLNLAAMQLL